MYHLICELPFIAFCAIGAGVWAYGAWKGWWVL